MIRTFATVCFLLCNHIVLAEKVYKHHFPKGITSLDPVSFVDVYSNKLAVSIYETLYTYKYLKSPLELKPQLATELPKWSADEKTLTITLKKGIYFSDDPAFPEGKGRELTAEDFVYNLKRHFDPRIFSSNRWIWEGKILGLDEWGKNGGDYQKEVKGLKAIDRYKIQIRLKHRYPQIVYTFAMGNSAIVPREAVEYYGKNLSIHPVGTGPWKLESLDHSKAVLTRNHKFRKEIFDPIAEGYEEEVHNSPRILTLAGKELPFVDKIEVYFLEQDAAVWNSFTKKSELQISPLPVLMFHDIMKSINPLQLHDKYASKYYVTQDLDLAYDFFVFNMDNPEIGYNPDPLRNKRNKALRCAIRKAFDWKQFLKKESQGMGIVFPGYIPPHVNGFDPQLSRDSITSNIEEARKLLKENGWNSSTLPVLKYGAAGATHKKQIFDMIKEWLKRIGYPAKKIKSEIYSQFPNFVRSLKENKLMISHLLWLFDFPDAENSFQLYYGPHASPGSNISNYRNPDFDRIFEEARFMKPGEKRHRLFQKLNEIIIEDCVSISGYTAARLHLHHKDVILYHRNFSNLDIFRYVALEAPISE